MMEVYLNSKNRLIGLETPLGLSLLSLFDVQEKIAVALPLEKEEKYSENISLLPYTLFLDRIEEYKVGLFFYNPDYIKPVLSLPYKKLFIISPYVLELDIPWFRYGNVGYSTTIVYTEEKEDLVTLAKKRVEEIGSQPTLIIVPNYNFLSQLISLLPEIQSYTYAEEISSNLLAVVSEQARLAAYFFLPKVVIDCCRQELLFSTTMGGYYKKEVYTDQREANSLARLASLKEEGLCYRLLSQKAFNSLPFSYPWPEYNYKSLLPLGEKNKEVLASWIDKGYPPFSLLGPLVILDNYDPLLFVYPPAVYFAGYLVVAEQQYKTFFSRFSGKDSLETLSNLWEIFLKEVGTFTPSYSTVREWCEKNSISTKKLWGYLEQVQICVNVLRKENIEVKTGPSSSKEIRDFAAPLFAEVYAERKMKRERGGFEYEGRILSVQFILLPSSLGVEDKEILGLILDKNGIVAGISLDI